MPFVSVCKQADLREGSMELFRVERKAVLVVWPQGGEVRAFRGRCPHQDVPLQEASFDGKTVVCERHDWRFDGCTGVGVQPSGCALKPYPMRLEDGELQIELKAKKAKKAKEARPAQA